MKKYLVMFSVLMVFFIACTVHAKKQNVIRVPGGTNIGGVGLVIDASYDPRLDTLVPGYKVVNAIVINQSFNIISLAPERDVWSVVLAGEKRPIKAIHNLRGQDPKAWSQLPERARQIVAYPLVLPIGGREVIDLFVPSNSDMEKFNELDVELATLGGKIEVLVSE
jgi:hypothetical protein